MDTSLSIDTCGKSETRGEWASSIPYLSSWTPFSRQNMFTISLDLAPCRDMPDEDGREANDHYQSWTQLHVETR